MVSGSSARPLLQKTSSTVALPSAWCTFSCCALEALKLLQALVCHSESISDWQLWHCWLSCSLQRSRGTPSGKLPARPPLRHSSSISSRTQPWSVACCLSQPRNPNQHCFRTLRGQTVGNGRDARRLLPAC